MRIQKELILSNLEVVQIDGGPLEDGRHLDVLKALVDSQNSDAAVMIYKSSDSSNNNIIITVYISSPDGVGDLQEIEVKESSTDDSVEIVAIRAVEAIQAGLLSRRNSKEISDDAPKKVGRGRDADKTPQKVEVDTSGKKASPSYPRFRLDARFLAEGATGGIGPMGALGVQWRWRPYGSIWLGLDGSVTAVGKDIEDGVSSASFDLALTRVSIGMAIRGKRFVHGLLGLSSGLGYVWTTGESTAIDDTKTDAAVLFYLGGLAEINFAVSQRIWIPIGIQVGVLPRGASVRFGGGVQAELNAVFMEGWCGVAVLFG